jgi:hypothetical protein
MRTRKTIVVPATPETTKEVEGDTFCDICGRAAPSRGVRGEWGEDSYAVAEVEVSMAMGSSYPEGGSSTVTEFDICPECFSSKVIPWLREQGASPRVEERDW